MTPWPSLAQLPLTVESCEYERLAAETADFLRVTTRVRLRGAGAEGLSEDVSPYGDEAPTLHAARPDLPLAGEWTLGSFCARLAEIDQWPIAPEWEPMRRWRNWAFEWPRSTSRSDRRAERCTRSWRSSRGRCAS